jgi:hypothetical protein
MVAYLIPDRQEKRDFLRSRFSLQKFYFNPAKTFATVSPIAAGVGQIVTPKSLNIATFSAALSPADEIIAPA